MSASTTHCAALALELSKALKLPYGVDRKAFIQEMGAALARHAQSDDHASRIKTHAAAHLLSCPVPAQIAELAREVAAGEEAEEYAEYREFQIPEQWKRGEVLCKRCGDSGWLITEKNGESGAEPCPCRPTPKAPETPVKPTSALRRADPRMLAAGGAE